jgi:SAM-dependent methyltransferase
MDKNYEAYQSSTVAALYKHLASGGLTTPEKYCLNLISDRGSVLDIGVGGGRTTGPLSSMFHKYIGIDYSEAMIVAAKSLFPGLDLRTMDARKLEFDEEFDCVVFSYNGIDSVNYNDRQLIFDQVAKVLRPGGYFIYSTHNLHNDRVSSLLHSLIVKELIRPLRGFLKPWNKIRPVVNRLNNFWRQSGDQEQPFAYVNDIAQDFQLLHTYVDVAKETETLRRRGLSVIATVGNRKKAPGYDADDAWVYVAAKSMK